MMVQVPTVSEAASGAFGLLRSQLFLGLGQVLDLHLRLVGIPALVDHRIAPFPAVKPCRASGRAAAPELTYPV